MSLKQDFFLKSSLKKCRCKHETIGTLYNFGFFKNYANLIHSNIFYCRASLSLFLTPFLLAVKSHVTSFCNLCKLIIFFPVFKKLGNYR